MKYHQVVLAGGNGYLGRVLAKYYQNIAHKVIILSRKPQTDDQNIETVIWDGKTSGNWAQRLENTDLLINLCGKNVNCRYHPANKDEIFASRLTPTALLGNVIGGLSNPPKLWINITSATIYRHAEDRPQDELHGEIGEGFSVEVCKQWEQTFFTCKTPQTRKIALRTSFVLGWTGGALPTLLKLAKRGLGGMQGNGNQYVSWIHEEDVARITDWLFNQPNMEGAINCTAPSPVKNRVLMHNIRDVFKIPFGLPAPVWLLNIGARLIGTETELVLKSRWVLPTRLISEGYVFKYPYIRAALLNFPRASSVK